MAWSELRLGPIDSPFLPGIALLEDASFPAIAGAVRSSEDGSYVIYGIAPGKYKLLALSTKYAEPFLTDEELELDRNVTEKIEVRERRQNHTRPEDGWAVLN
jgi:hypothetical protein